MVDDGSESNYESYKSGLPIGLFLNVDEKDVVSLCITRWQRECSEAILVRHLLLKYP